jgi:hypothetical protein
MRRPLPAIATLGTIGFLALHELGRRWGATDDEVRGPMTGDDIVPHAKGQTTHAITIDTAVEDVWPWLVQMGYHRAGWYTYPWVDRYLWHIENPEREPDRPGAPGPFGRRHRPGRRARYRLLPRGGPGPASHACAALHVARPPAAARTDGR